MNKYLIYLMPPNKKRKTAKAHIVVNKYLNDKSFLSKDLFHLDKNIYKFEFELSNEFRWVYDNRPQDKIGYFEVLLEYRDKEGVLFQTIRPTPELLS